ncbi:MAG: hypothetical protein JO149_03185 [Gammaproteobacteria bacterium]|nr:hypothetical protein [Gammaproteobacteria bacterium]
MKKEKSINTQLMMGMEKIDQLANYAGEIIHRMKNFLRGGELSKEKINMNVLIMQALTFLEHQKRELKFKIILNLAENLPLIWVDAIKIIQVILNLAQNSIEAFQFQKSCFLEIIVESKLINNYIEINIKDNGPGISEKIIDKVTNSYVTTKPQGTGLGLPICRTIIEAHGGELFIQKNNKIGTCICFTLPTLLSDNE